MPELSDAPLDRPVIRGALAALLCLGLGRVLIAFPTKTTDVGDWLNRNGPDAPGYPVQAAVFLSRTVSPRSGRLINEFNWGGYLAWRLGDHYQVLLDGRTQVYAPRFWQDVYLGDGDTRRQVLTASQADAAILPVGNSRFRSTLLSMGWKPVHRDDRAEVLVPPEKSIADVNETDRHE